MFGDMMSLMGKLKEAKAKAEATKERLKTIFIQEQDSEKLVKITASAHGRLREIYIDPKVMEDKEQLEDYLLITINRALEKAQNIHDTEMAVVAKEGLPNMPELDFFK